MDEPEHARQLVEDMRRGMDRVAHDKHTDGARGVQNEGNNSPQKKQYGDRWSLIFGITKGMGLMRRGHEKEYDFDTGETEDKGISDKHWQEHYNEFGYGQHGVGLELGKRLAFYSGSDFDFVQSSNDSDNDFTFVNPEEDESQFTFTQ